MFIFYYPSLESVDLGDTEMSTNQDDLELKRDFKTIKVQSIQHC